MHYLWQSIMKFYSTKHEVERVGLKKAVLESLPADNGLYMPEEIKQLPIDFFEKAEGLSFAELSFQFARVLMQDLVPEEVLRKIVHETVNFDAPLISLEDRLHCLELWHGPSLAFKDFGARFMSRLMSHLCEDDNAELDILVATSGDTGGAVALGFYDTPGIRVTILYPSGKVSMLQEKQLTTLGKNITALEVDGSFDDCQRLVKTAFLDEDLSKRFRLSSANSINIARLIPQCFYYLQAYMSLKNKSKPVYMCVPSGNFGNITAGLIAKRMGLPFAGFIASNNANKVFYNYIETGVYQPSKTVATISNAMDVGAPSNFQRILDLYGGAHEKIAQDVSAYSFDDQQTEAAIGQLHQQYAYVACPHTAVAYLGAQSFLQDHPDAQVVFQSTAHPSKFLDSVEPIIGTSVELPAALLKLKDRPKNSIPVSPDYAEFKAFLLSRG